MTYIISISEFRNNIFNYTSLIDKGHDLVIEKEGKAIYKVTKHTDDSVAKATKMLQLLPHLKGIWKDNQDDFFRGSKETEYMKKITHK